ncbi:DNA N-6-adenine-methyltransferase [Staphylococcus capitis]|uniref:DNA N-6-adenine-methyltransferase n=1 Tax=Staphylococcus capitis TaxID=29388 RepID=UPI0018879B29|nr:DNA N-6-adenine-methyltransferase [Staphylococcus capitis]MBF2243326.1 adenine methyltransferase [Staphylococcus capitis]MBF2248152.1 adenine methyltransferase [Staphylococcus capitis]MDS4009683.1 DNA N-6-adenine-methyltransferase [Staphylococcus capitis]
MEIHYSSKSNEWATPMNLFNELNKEFDFTLDPCSTHENAKCKKHFTIKENGLKRSWSKETVFMNPPYGREIKKWVEKAYKESLKGTTVVCLIPARTDTTYWHDFIFGKADDIRFLRGRLKFGDSKNSAPFPSAIVIYRGSKNE